MAHPFMKMLEKALKKSTLSDNQVLVEAERLKDKGYSPEELYGLLKKMHHGRTDDSETEIVADALEEFSEYVDQDSL